MNTHLAMPLPMNKTVFSITLLLILIFSKYIYMASLTSYYTFYLIHKFGVTVQASQLFLFVFLVATAIGTLVGGPVGDRVGRKYVIWASILGTAPFSMMMPHVGLAWTVVLSFCVGLMLSSAFPAGFYASYPCKMPYLRLLFLIAAPAAPDSPASPYGSAPAFRRTFPPRGTRRAGIRAPRP